MSKATIAAPDLTQRPPRSARVRLGGFAILPRMLDKGRATLAGKQGEYHYNCPLDQHVIRFIGFDPDALLGELKKGKGDGEILNWLQQNGNTTRSPWEVQQWSDYQDKRGPDSDAETYDFFGSYVKKFSETREDIRSWFDVLDLDDHVSFGGPA